MKTVILAGGKGTRISEEGGLRPKPLVEIGGFPILWHIMKYYSHFGHSEFIICAGHNGYLIKEYFAQYYLHASDITFDFSKNNEVTIHNNIAEPWRVTIVDTGQEAQTGCRVKRVEKYVGNEPFFLTYGDGLSNIALDKLAEQHIRSDNVVTISIVKPAGRFGVIEIDADKNKALLFREKSTMDSAWINAGFMVVSRSIFDYLPDKEDCILERAPFQKICVEKRLGTYRHDGFWQCMDTPRDRLFLEKLWIDKKAFWKTW